MRREKDYGMRKSGSPLFLLMFYTLLLIMMAGLSGCGGGSGGSTVAKTEPETITIQPADNKLYLGATKQFSLVSSYTGAITTSVGWVSSNPSVASISPSGMLSAIAVGDVTITATLAGVPYKTTTLKVIATTFANVSSVVTPLNVAGVWKGTYEIVEARDPSEIGIYDYEFNLAQSAVTVTGTSLLRRGTPREANGTFSSTNLDNDVLMFNFTYFDSRALYSLLNSGFAKITASTLTGEAVENDIYGWNCRYKFNLIKQ